MTDINIGGEILAQGILGENGMIGRLANNLETTITVVVGVVAIIWCIVYFLQKRTFGALIIAGCVAALLLWLVSAGGVSFLGERVGEELESSSAPHESTEQAHLDVS